MFIPIIKSTCKLRIKLSNISSIVFDRITSVAGLQCVYRFHALACFVYEFTASMRSHILPQRLYNLVAISVHAFIASMRSHILLNHYTISLHDFSTRSHIILPQGLYNFVAWFSMRWQTLLNAYTISLHDFSMRWHVLLNDYTISLHDLSMRLSFPCARICSLNV